MRSFLAVAVALALSAGLLALAACGRRANDVAVPASCNGTVNAPLAELIADDHAGAVDDVMVCGTAFAQTHLRRGTRSAHQLIGLTAPLPGGRSARVEVVTNDNLDGIVSAPPGAHVIAYGQYFRPTAAQRPFVAGLHDTHCSTHRGADNGWVVVNGVRYPPSCGS